MAVATIRACLVLVVGAAAMIAPGHASAQTCECDLGPIGVVVWPPDGATDVPGDSPIVIQRHSPGGDLEAITFGLANEAGTQLPLEEVRRLEPAFEGCGESQFIFLRPSNPLTPGVTYVLSIGGDPAPEDRRGATFMAVAGNFEPDPSLDARPIYLSVLSETPCNEPRCRIAELYLDLGAPPERDLWLVVTSSANTDNAVQGSFFPAYVFDGMPLPDWIGTMQLSVAVPPDDPCIDVEVFGVDATTLLQERLCEPDRCAFYDNTRDGFCGLPPTSGIDATRIAADSCAEPPVLHFEPGVGIEYPDAGPVTAGAGGADSGVPSTRPDPPRAGASSEPPPASQEDGGVRDAGPALPDAGPALSPDSGDGGNRRSRKDSGCTVRVPGAPSAAGVWQTAIGIALGLRARRRQRV